MKLLILRVVTPWLHLIVLKGRVLIAMIEIYFRAQPKCYQIRMPSLFLVENRIEMSLEVVHQSSLEILTINKLCILI